MQDTGLDEIRFDISANSYRLDKVEMAVGKIPQVTVEIPTVPEDADQLLAAMRELDRLGVNFLNLHQLRLTPHNRPQLAGRNYTYLHGPRVTVLESELAALRLLAVAVRERLRLAVNYCSYIYKFRYQTMAARRRSAAFINKPHESITATGLLRTLTVRAAAAELQNLVADFTSRGLPADLWQFNSAAATLHLAPQLLHHLDPRRHSLSVRYHAAALKPAITYHNSYREIELSSRRRLIVERTPLDTELAVAADKLPLFTGKIMPDDATPWPETSPGGNQPTDWEKIVASESFRAGLYEYY
ncbi:MAG: hypothetical protein A2521_06945 [Deltaproteobacteria bacterium RIFOXYD12_FULL_57_12]|nr:MAG: hypothetical protein A2521_06945 [Deltaproteobacteria bacterium RIFOXYD12_FULL_57_12]